MDIVVVCMITTHYSHLLPLTHTHTKIGLFYRIAQDKHPRTVVKLYVQCERERVNNTLNGSFTTRVVLHTTEKTKIWQQRITIRIPPSLSDHILTTNVACVKRKIHWPPNLRLGKVKFSVIEKRKIVFLIKTSKFQSSKCVAMVHEVAFDRVRGYQHLKWKNDDQMTQKADSRMSAGPGRTL